MDGHNDSTHTSTILRWSEERSTNGLLTICGQSSTIEMLRDRKNRTTEPFRKYLASACTHGNSIAAIARRVTHGSSEAYLRCVHARSICRNSSDARVFKHASTVRLSEEVGLCKPTNGQRAAIGRCEIRLTTRETVMSIQTDIHTTHKHTQTKYGVRVFGKSLRIKSRMRVGTIWRPSVAQQARSLCRAIRICMGVSSLWYLGPGRTGICAVRRLCVCVELAILVGFAQQTDCAQCS